MRIVFYITLFIFVNGCTTTTDQKNTTSEFTVDIEKDLTKVLPQINKSALLELEHQANLNNQISKKKIPVIAMLLGPGLNKAIATIPIFKELKKNKIPIHIISGVGLSSITAALFAKGNTPDKIEWFFYKLFNKVKDIVPFSKKWAKIVYELLLIEFDTKVNIQDLKLSLIIPVYDSQNKRVIYLKKGNLLNALAANINLYNDKYFSNFSTVLPWEMFNPIPFREYGADIVIGIDIIGKDINFISGNDYLIGVFGKAINLIPQHQSKLNLLLQMNNSSMPLDCLTKIPQLLQKAYTFSKENVPTIKHTIKTWSSREPDSSLYSEYNDDKIN